MWPTIIGGLLSMGSQYLNKPKEVDISGQLEPWKERMGQMGEIGEDMMDWGGDQAGRVKAYLQNQASNAGSQIGNQASRMIGKFGQYSGIAAQQGREAMSNSMSKVGGQFLDWFGKAQQRGAGILGQVMGNERAYGETMANQDLLNQSNQDEAQNNMWGSVGDFGKGLITKGLESWGG